MKSAISRPGGADFGFSLLELLVALSVLAVILVLLSQGVQFGLRTTDAQAAYRRRHEDLEAIDRTLRRMIALTDPGIYPTPPSLRGTAQRLSFTSELPGSITGAAQQADIALGLEGTRLVMRWSARRHAERFTPLPPPGETVLLDGLERAEFAYSAGGTWQTAWTAEQLPVLIRLTLTFPGGSRSMWPPIVAAPLREALEQ